MKSILCQVICSDPIFAWYFMSSDMLCHEICFVMRYVLSHDMSQVMWHVTRHMTCHFTCTSMYEVWSVLYHVASITFSAQSDSLITHILISVDYELWRPKKKQDSGMKVVAKRCCGNHEFTGAVNRFCGNGRWGHPPRVNNSTQLK